MASFAGQLSSAGPALTLSPTRAQGGMAGNPFGLCPADCSGGPKLPETSCSLHNATLQPTESSTKRKRKLTDDVICDAKADMVTGGEEGWVYGEGMVLVKPNSSYVADASSQSGTWVEAEAAAKDGSRADAPDPRSFQHEDLLHPALRSHKSQKLEQFCSLSPGREPQNNPPSVEQPGGRRTLDITPAEHEPIDELAIHLGVGWRRIDVNSDKEAAARGWSRYIERHYPISSARICLESKGLQSYLVEAAEGYFLFDENLRQGRLLSESIAGALQNLKSVPPVFDGKRSLTALESPAAPCLSVVSTTSPTLDSARDVEMAL